MKTIYIIGVVAVTVAIVMLTTPGLANSLIASLTGSSQSCRITPYDSKCLCEPVGERKISVPWLGMPRWSCENLELLVIDPESPTFEQDAVEFTKNQFEYYCSDICTNLECGEICSEARPDMCTGDKYMVAVWGWDSAGRRSVNIECRIVTQRDSQGREVSGYCPWRMWFHVESPTDILTTYEVFADKNYCTDPQNTKVCTTQRRCDLRNNPQNCYPRLQMNVIPTPVQNFLASFDTSYPSPV